MKAQQLRKQNKQAQRKAQNYIERETSCASVT